MANKKKIGNDCKAYRNTGTYGSPVWNEMTEVGDVSLPLSKGRGEFRTRSSKFVKKKGGKIEAALNASYVYDPGDDDWVALRDSFLNNTALDVAVMDGPIATIGSQGLRADMEVMEIPVEEPLEDGVTVAIVLEPTISDNEPTWTTTA